LSFVLVPCVGSVVYFVFQSFFCLSPWLVFNSLDVATVVWLYHNIKISSRYDTIKI
jgi:hypothetical protein